jgi:hypothetical protein
MCETNILYYLCGCYVKDVRRYGCGPYTKTQEPHCEYMDRYEDRRMEECYDCAAETKRVQEMLELEKVGDEGVEGGDESGGEEESSGSLGEECSGEECSGEECSEEEGPEKGVEDEGGKQQEVTEENAQKELPT